MQDCLIILHLKWKFQVLSSPASFSCVHLSNASSHWRWFLFRKWNFNHRRSRVNWHLNSFYLRFKLEDLTAFVTCPSNDVSTAFTFYPLRGGEDGGGMIARTGSLFLPVYFPLSYYNFCECQDIFHPCLCQENLVLLMRCWDTFLPSLQ